MYEEVMKRLSQIEAKIDQLPGENITNFEERLRNELTIQLNRLEAKADQLLDRLGEFEEDEDPECPACGGSELLDASRMGDEPGSTLVCGGEKGCGLFLEIAGNGQ